jgi:prepilin-type processing-associated H-X9-DG protein
MFSFPSDGVFQLGDTVALSQIKDGYSNTIMVGEKHVPQNGFGHGGLDSSIYNGDTLSPFRGGGPLYPLVVSDYDDRWAFGSSHPGLCQFVFMDGHVRPIRTGTDPRFLGQLCSRDDGQIIDWGQND